MTRCDLLVSSLTASAHITSRVDHSFLSFNMYKIKHFVPVTLKKRCCLRDVTDVRVTILKLCFFDRYTNEMLKAILDDGVKVKGYMAWTLMDNFEWGSAYTTPYGLHFVDFENDPDLTRVPKKSVSFFKQLIANNGFPDPDAKSESAKMLPNVTVIFAFIIGLIIKPLVG